MPHDSLLGRIRASLGRQRGRDLELRERAARGRERLAAGAETVGEGIERLETGAERVGAGLERVERGAERLGERAERLEAAAEEFQTGATGRGGRRREREPMDFGGVERRSRETMRRERPESVRRGRREESDDPLDDVLL